MQQTRCGMRRLNNLKQGATALPRLFANRRDLILREFDRFDVWHRPDLGHRRQLVAVPADRVLAVCAAEAATALLRQM